MFDIINELLTVKGLSTLALIFLMLYIVYGGLKHREKSERGFTWLFIRYLTIGMCLPLIGILALNNALPSEVVALIGSAIGFAFGKTDGKKGTGTNRQASTVQ